MIEIETEEPTHSACECCGNTTVKLTRFVYRDGDAYAIYYASFTEGHHEKAIKGVVCFGEWGDDSTDEASRTSFPFVLWEQESNFGVTLVDAKESPWFGADVLGNILDRADSLEHPKKAEAFHVTDHMLIDDPVIVAHFESE